MNMKSIFPFQKLAQTKSIGGKVLHKRTCQGNLGPAFTFNILPQWPGPMARRFCSAYLGEQDDVILAIRLGATGAGGVGEVQFH